MVISGALCALNMSIFYVDVRSRKIYLLQLLLMLALALFSCWQSGQGWTDWGIKVTWVIAQLALLAVYARLAKGMSLFKGFGMGDLLLLLAITPLFTPVTFIAFYISGLMFGLVAGLVFHHRQNMASARIPLAGLLSLWMIPFLVFEQSINDLLTSLLL